MKTVVIGDIHGRNIWKDIVNKHYDETDKFIFLGDYVSTHDRKLMDSDLQINNLKDILDFAETENRMTPGRVVLLRGNHDMQHLGYYWASCSGLDMHVQKDMMEIKDRFLANTQWIYVDDNIVYSHAGISDRWMQDNKLTDVYQINDLEPSEKFGFTPCKLSDYTGDSVTQPPTWIRPWALLGNCFGNYTYVVGHTSYDYPVNIKYEAIEAYKQSYFDDNQPINQEVIDRYESYNDIWVCDCLKTGHYIIVEDGKINTHKIEMDF